LPKANKLCCFRPKNCGAGAGAGHNLDTAEFIGKTKRPDSNRKAKRQQKKAQPDAQQKGPDSSVVEHLHGKQKVEGSIPFLGKRRTKN
jgi:hypothetical protein